MAEESPCSHGAEMHVVITPGEKISQGSLVNTELTAGKMPKSFIKIWLEYL